MSNSLITVEVAYALIDKQALISINIDANSTLKHAITESKILFKFPEIDLENAQIGVFGQMKKLDAILKNGDRVEIYRPLICDPKQARRNRAK